MDKYLKIGSSRVLFSQINRRSVKGVWIDAVARYTFWDGVYQDQPLLLLCLKDGAEAYTPVQSAALAAKLQEANQKLVVYYFDALDFNKRERLMAQGVYFIVGEKYVSLPSLMINSRTDRKEKATELSAPAQYLLLFHLQERSLEGMSAKEMACILPYKYVTITLAMQVLADLDLCKIETDNDKTRRIHFEISNRDLYEKAQILLQSPIRKTFYCDDVNVALPVAGINALAKYSMLAPEQRQTFAVDERQVKLKAKDNPFIGINSWDGAYRIEIWKYPPIVKDGAVDRLSLALSMKNDEDPRVCKEVKQMIDELWS